MPRKRRLVGSKKGLVFSVRISIAVSPVIGPKAFCPDWVYAAEVRPLLGYGPGIRVGADAPESSRSRTCVASTKSKRTVPSLNVSPAWNALSPKV